MTDLPINMREALARVAELEQMHGLKEWLDKLPAATRDELKTLSAGALTYIQARTQYGEVLAGQIAEALERERERADKAEEALRALKEPPPQN